MTHLHIKLLIFQSLPGASQVVLVVKNPSADAGVIRDVGSILGQEDLLEEGTATHCSILAWRIPWTEEPGGLVHRVIQSRTRLKQLSTHACTVFPGGSGSKEYACNVGDLGLIPGWGRASGEGNGSPLQYSCLENPEDKGVWRATVHGVTKSWTCLSD